MTYWKVHGYRSLLCRLDVPVNRNLLARSRRSLRLTTSPEGVTMAIEGEVHAIGEYAELAMMAPNPRARELILCIQKDEMYHKISFEFIQSVIMWNGYDEND